MNSGEQSEVSLLVSRVTDHITSVLKQWPVVAVRSGSVPEARLGQNCDTYFLCGSCLKCQGVWVCAKEALHHSQQMFFGFGPTSYLALRPQRCCISVSSVLNFF